MHLCFGKNSDVTESTHSLHSPVVAAVQLCPNPGNHGLCSWGFLGKNTEANKGLSEVTTTELELRCS